jgi:hypothetical protein
VAVKKETRFLPPWFLWLRKRNRVSVVEITVNCGSKKRNPVSESLVFVPRKRNRVSVVEITVNCGSQKRNPVSESLVFVSRGDRYFICEKGDRYFI